MPAIVDVPLRGQFTVKAHSRPSHGQTKAISRALRARLKEEQIEELLVDNILTLCTAWDVTDEEGHPIPFTREGIASAPDDLVTELADRLQQFVNRGLTFDQKVKALADDLGDDDPRKVTLLGIIDSGN